MRQPWLVATIILSELVAIGYVLSLVAMPAIRANAAHAKSPISPTLAFAISAAVLVMSIGTAALFLCIKLITEVRPDGLYIQYFPFHLSFRKIPLEDATTIEAVTYRPIGDYGGWGIRYGKRGRAYNVSGNRGVRIEYPTGSSVLIGSQKAEELAEAIKDIRG